jgi:ferritin-like protein
MTDSSKSLHEENLSASVVDRHRAIVSLMEELEAADWYAQRAEATADPELRAILEHNGDEEKEHAAMVLEWLRRRDSALAGHLKTYLYQEGSITEREEQKDEAPRDADSASTKPAAKRPGSDGSLGIGSLKARSA